MEKRKISYKAVPTLARFHLSNALVRGVMGPRGSSKSTGMSVELFRRANQQKPFHGVRKSRWAIIRNTYRELKDTTVKTWLKWFPEDIYGDFNYGNMVQHIKDEDLDAEFIFRALDRPGDIKKVLSLELTGAWINEAREVPLGIINGIMDAIGRYPSKDEGGATWRGLIMDTNPPSNRHWWYRIAEKERPENWEFFRQPGGLIEVDGKFIPNPKAENIENLSEGYGYYTSKVGGAALDHIRVYYCAEYGFVKEGKPVYPEYYDSVHCPGEMFKPVQGLPIFVGLDFGLTPAALFAQRLVNGRWIWFDEIVTEDMGIQRFTELLGPRLNEYQGWQIQIFGDPAGNTRVQTDEKTCYQILEANKIKATPTTTNNFTIRRESVATSLRRMIDGRPGLMLSPKCAVAREAMMGGYQFRKLQVVSEEDKFQEEPDKNFYSHIAEAGQYAMLGAGEGEVITQSPLPKLNLRFGSGATKPGHGWMQ